MIFYLLFFPFLLLWFPNKRPNQWGTRPEEGSGDKEGSAEDTHRQMEAGTCLDYLEK